MTSRVPRTGVLVCFLALVVGGGLGIGYATAPGEWYTTLATPSFTPPAWVFPIAWTVLYVLIAIAGWRTFVREAGGRSMKIWWLQLFLNFLWPIVFFGAHAIGMAFAIIMLLLSAIVLFIANVAPRDGLSALLFTPYAAWVAFAAILNGAIFAAN